MATRVPPALLPRRSGLLAGAGSLPQARIGVLSPGTSPPSPPTSLPLLFLSFKNLTPRSLRSAGSGPASRLQPTVCPNSASFACLLSLRSRPPLHPHGPSHCPPPSPGALAQLLPSLQATQRGLSSPKRTAPLLVTAPRPTPSLWRTDSFMPGLDPVQLPTSPAARPSHTGVPLPDVPS